MAGERNTNVGPDGGRRIVLPGTSRIIKNETNRSIRKVMEAVEKHTNYNELDEDVKELLRDTILNQINKLSRVISHKRTMNFNR